MKQLIQDFKTGKLYVDEIAIPAISDGMLLVENRFSLISAGTEKSTVDVGKASLIGKAMKRPDLVRQVLQNYRKEGFMATFDKVTTKLSSFKALGYSSAGVVITSLDIKGQYKTGDRVACAGQDYASHAAVVGVPQNLVARIPDNVSFEEATFTTLGAIALQGVRQANPTLGENVCVIGLGLLGQITCQLLKANGCRVFGIDVSNRMVALTNQLGYAEAMERNHDNLNNIANNFTNGYGFDKVIITASAPTNDPIVLATEILRKKGTMVIVGSVPMDIPREPFFYKKELDLKISCSYGPGRYDIAYEEDGVDYPIGYVRWTEQRNMEAFLNLLSDGKINVKPLTTHIFDIEEAEKGYDIVLGKHKTSFIGILLQYPTNVENKNRLIPTSGTSQKVEKVHVGFIGAGSFAQSYLIPNVKNLASLGIVVTRTGINAKNVAQKFKFPFSSTNPDDILNDSSINTVFIATQHDTHADYTIRALKKGKAVFVEKPLAMNYEELQQIQDILATYPSSKLMVGFNRRFANLSTYSKKLFADIKEPLVINYRINAGFIPKDHWTQTQSGGGRIIGEVCHFIDLMQFYTNAKPVKVYADCIKSENERIKNDDNIVICIRFSDGSVGNITYIANGDKTLPKERVEIFGGGLSFVNDDFQNGYFYSKGKEHTIKGTGKGHQEEVEAFIKFVKGEQGNPISNESMLLTTLTSFKIIDSLLSGLPQDIVL
jgi:predicted dehydrogenase/threonine dehydrogenase-like Zn-dependent dehydrogenase